MLFVSARNLVQYGGEVHQTTARTSSNYITSTFNKRISFRSHG